MCHVSNVPLGQIWVRQNGINIVPLIVHMSTAINGNHLPSIKYLPARVQSHGVLPLSPRKWFICFRFGFLSSCLRFPWWRRAQPETGGIKGNAILRLRLKSDSSRDGLVKPQSLKEGKRNMNVAYRWLCQFFVLVVHVNICLPESNRMACCPNLFSFPRYSTWCVYMPPIFCWYTSQCTQYTTCTGVVGDAKLIKAIDFLMNPEKKGESFR